MDISIFSFNKVTAHHWPRPIFHTVSRSDERDKAARIPDPANSHVRIFGRRKHNSSGYHWPALFVESDSP